MSEQGNIELFTSDDGQIQLAVSLQEDSVWLTQAQMAALFAKDVRTISEHIGHVFSEGELSQPATIRKFRIVRKEGQRQVRREIDHYNLDMIISVGYRVKSQRGVQFRQWATRTLKQHLVAGYTLNQRRLLEREVQWEQALDLLSHTLTHQAMVTETGATVIALVQDYAHSWSVLQGYDEQSLAENRAKQASMNVLALPDALNAIAELKQVLLAKAEATALFGQLRGDGLASTLASIEQGFGQEWLYPNIASRAAHLLYFVIKNHPFVDGNKRIGSLLFLCYLRSNQHLLAKPVSQLINDNTLIALALLVAESVPEQKTLMIRLLEHVIRLEPTQEGV